ncbi:hypothetical protein DQW77_06515 [Roseovarius sp. TE539]|uniref:hypothetical protein n=1 Tax=Roseovarius sp. TE539 TaxID=2249812 RepID=UPI000DDFE125|nr:hypothetical protein [Roseovarius sp. TE539]RBI74595.1 hypothetical protein DQW77_06515 [Roseovarius sp. TE539]
MSVSIGRVEVADPFLARFAPGRFPYLADFGYRSGNEVATGQGAGYGHACRRQPLVDPGLRRDRA